MRELHNLTEHTHLTDFTEIERERAPIPEDNKSEISVGREEEDSKGHASPGKEDEIKRKSGIKFIYTSADRRNVDKHIIRSLLLNYKALEAKIVGEMKKNDVPEHYFHEVDEMLSAIRKKEKSGAKDVKKDYTKAINLLLKDKSCQVVLKTLLEYDLNILRDPDCFMRITDKNKEIYITTIEDYLQYLREQLQQNAEEHE